MLIFIEHAFLERCASKPCFKVLELTSSKSKCGLCSTFRLVCPIISQFYCKVNVGSCRRRIFINLCSLPFCSAVIMLYNFLYHNVYVVLMQCSVIMVPRKEKHLDE